MAESNGRAVRADDDQITSARISKYVRRHVKRKSRKFEAFDDTLRRLLKLKKRKGGE